MALPTTVTYSTIALFNLHTPVAAQRTMIEADWKPYALRAEAILDSYVRVLAKDRYAEDQYLAFPIKDEDEASYLPEDVIRAHIEITSDLILKGDAVAETGYADVGETWSSSSYSKNKQKKASSSSDDLKINMPPLARRLLMPWSNNSAGITY